jgi:hypothetical protein
VLPIRRSNGKGAETARFRYEAWEREAVKRTEVAQLQSRIDELQRAIARSSASISNLDSNNDRKGWSSSAACETLKVPELGSQELDRPVAPPAEQDGVARQVCIMRVAAADADLDRSVEQQMKSGKVKVSADVVKLLLSLESGDAQTPLLLSRLYGLLKEGDRGLFESRLDQFRELDHDWNQYSGATLKAYKTKFPRPHFESFSDTLLLQTEANNAGERIEKALLDGKDPDPKDLRGFIASSLQAYSSCVLDGKNQLQTNYRNATELAARTPAIREEVRREIVHACQAGVSKLDEMKTERQQWQDELTRDEQKMQETASSSALPAKPQALNFVSCTP